MLVIRNKDSILFPIYIRFGVIFFISWIFHKSCVIRVHQLVAYVKSQEVCFPLHRCMRQMDKDGKNMVAEFIYRHAV